MVFSHLPFSIAGIIYSRQWKFAGLIAWVLGFYSVLGHKKFRFVLPVLPIALMFSGYSLAVIKGPCSPLDKGKGSSKMHSKNGSCYLILACYQYSNGFVYEFGSSERS
ncbi:hypothetical protein L6164_014122 [Bauhinia variegata]|uniref:Uncharacterized protein n=1 Tax=Bauhinia variegata TaxID=167791 RepID=A0ACB9NGW2_BAUVA|nr:hypothetical protein L6164_014122 [Bauhinia variegata]